MYLSSHTRRCLILAEKLLASQHVEGCLDICNEIELLMEEMKKEGIIIKEQEHYLQKIRSIRLKLNAIMANKLRQKIAN